MSSIEASFANAVIIWMKEERFVENIATKIKEFKTSYLIVNTDEVVDEDQNMLNLIDSNVQQSGGKMFTPTMRSSGKNIKGSKDKYLQSLRSRKIEKHDKHSFIEFLYYSTYSFYHVFSKVLKIRETETIKFFNDYVQDLMTMFKKNYSNIVNNSSIYINCKSTSNYI